MTSPSSSRPTRSEQVTPRRRFVAALGTGVLTTLAGCGTVLRSDPQSLNPPERIDERPLSRAWEFPRGASDEQTTVQAYLEQAYPAQMDGPPGAIRFRFGATVFDDSKYRHERITLRLRADREGTAPPADIYVHPLAGGFTSFRTYVDDQEMVIVLSELEETGTLQFGFLVDASTAPYPETLDYRFRSSRRVTACSRRTLLPRTAVGSRSSTKTSEPSRARATRHWPALPVEPR